MAHTDQTQIRVRLCHYYEDVAIVRSEVIDIVENQMLPTIRACQTTPLDDIYLRKYLSPDSDGNPQAMVFRVLAKTVDPAFNTEILSSMLGTPAYQRSLRANLQDLEVPRETLNSVFDLHLLSQSDEKALECLAESQYLEYSLGFGYIYLVSLDFYSLYLQLQHRPKPVCDILDEVEDEHLVRIPIYRLTE